MYGYTADDVRAYELLNTLFNGLGNMIYLKCIYMGTSLLVEPAAVEYLMCRALYCNAHNIGTFAMILCLHFLGETL